MTNAAGIERREGSISIVTTTRAAVLSAPGKIEVRDVELAPLAADAVRVRLEGCGVCASNLELWAGQPWFNYPVEPGAPGHEGWGRIIEVGADVKGFQAGERVAMLSSHAYAEIDTAPASSLVPLPAELDGVDFPGEPLGCAVNIFKRSEIEAGQTVAIVGIGFLGAILTRLATDAGARVIAVTRRDYALRLAQAHGAAELVSSADYYQAINRVMELTGGRGCERVIEATGKQTPLDLAAQLTATRARLVIAGYHQDGARQIDMQLWNWRGLDCINAHERDESVYLQGIRDAIELVRTGKLDPAPLYTHRFPLDQLGAALDHTRDRPEGFLKALITL